MSRAADTSLIPYDGLLDSPIKRAAYSDRTAWLMAVMSQLAYIKFEEATPIDLAMQEAMTLITGEEDRKKQDRAKRLNPAFNRAGLRNILAGVAGGANRGQNRKELEAKLESLGFRLVETFSVHIPLVADTQAFLAKMEKDGRDPFLVLSFHGTESNKITDVKSDVKADFTSLGRLGGPGGSMFISADKVKTFREKSLPQVKVHSGFWQAFKAIEGGLRETLKDKKLPLYITGHDLGGALAVVATYVLNNDHVAACYTFGSPRVGNLQYGMRITPPVYRVINASDIVSRVPPGVLVDVITVFLRAIPAILYAGQFADFLERFRGYRHYGDMRHLGACKAHHDDGTGKNLYPHLTVRKNPPQMMRWYWLFQRWIITMGRAAIADHNIQTYVDKLAFWAHIRSKNSGLWKPQDG